MGQLVGRTRELAQLRGWLADARSGAGRLVLLEGEAGIGKTSLARVLAASAAEDGFTVATALCSSTSGAPPYWPLRQLVRGLGRDPDEVLAHEGDAASRLGVFDAITDVVRTAAAGGLLVVVDDAHWCDEASLRALRHIADRVVDHAVVIVIAFRGAEPDSALPLVLPELARAPRTERITLRGLVPDEVAELAGVDDVTAHEIAAATGGNPLFVREVARTIADGSWVPGRTPQTVLDLVGATVGALPDDVRRAIAALAVIGDAASVTLLSDVLEVSVPQCLPLLDAAVARGILEPPAPTGLVFTHALVRDAVVATLPTAERLDLHRRVAEVLERGAGAEERSADIARHRIALAALGETAAARAWTLRAADRALHALAFEEALRLYDAALSLPGPWDDVVLHVGAHLGRARTLRLIGDVDGGLAAATAGAEAARRAGRPDLVGESALAIDVVPAPHVGVVIAELCDEAFAGLAEDTAPSLRARLLAQQSHLAFYGGDQSATLALSRAALELAHESEDDVALTAALHARVEACPGPSGRSERLGLAADMLAVAASTGSAASAMWGRIWRIDALVESGEIASARAELPALERAAGRVGGPTSAWHADRAAACIAQALGDGATADVLSRKARGRLLAFEPAPATGAFIALQCALARHFGPSEEALATVRSGIEPPPRFRMMGNVSRAYLLMLAGDVAAAHVELDRAPAPHAWEWPAHFRLVGLGLLALTASELGRDVELQAALAGISPWRAEHLASSGIAYQGPVTLALGRIAIGLGRIDEAVTDLTEALATAERCGTPAFAAEAGHHLAVALRARGADGDAERARRAATDSAAIVRALGLRPFGAPEPVAAEAGLSPREAEVADLVAEGLSNRAIADRLVISERTAQNHVQHILTKLGFTSRAQIAAWRARLSTVDEHGR